MEGHRLRTMTATRRTYHDCNPLLVVAVASATCLFLVPVPAWSWLLHRPPPHVAVGHPPFVQHQQPSVGLHHALLTGTGTSSSGVRQLHLASSDDTGEDIVPWTLPNDFDTFLNQCSVQSFLFLLQSLRDGNSALWLDNFTQPLVSEHDLPVSIAGSTTRAADSVKLLHYHGLAAINATLFPTWDTYFGTLLDRPKVTYTITSNRAYIPDYELEIVPASLCSRLLSVREQIAREFAKDLDVIATSMGRKALEAYMRSSTDSALREGGDTAAAGSDPASDSSATDATATDESDLQSSSLSGQGHPNRRRLQRPTLFFLELPTDSNAVDPSPLRKGNFDLLLLLCTQESVQRVLQDPNLDSASRYYLQNFYLERLYTHFMGNVPYGRADDFVEELLWQTPRLVRSTSAHEDSLVSWLFSYQLVDPLRLAESILHQREVVATEWKNRATEAPFHHMSIKRMQLNLLMGRPANMTTDTLG